MTDSDTLAVRAAELRSQTDDLVTRATRQAQTLEATQAQSTGVQGTATSPDGSVHAVVDSAGMLISLRLPDAALAAKITETVQVAAAQARGEVRRLYTGLVNEGVISTLPGHLPAPPTVSVAPPSRPRPAVAEPDEDRGFQRDAW